MADTDRDVNVVGPVFRQAVKLFQSGYALKGEQLLRAQLTEAELKFTKSSRHYFCALRELATLIYHMSGGKGDRMAEAIELFEEAVAVDLPQADYDFNKMKLATFTDVGDFLISLGYLEQAEAVLKNALQLRLKFYTNNHAGYGSFCLYSKCC